MKSYLVLGLGRFGRSLAQTLTRLGYDVLGVDNDMNIVQELADSITRVIQAEVDNEDFLESIGVRNFDAVVVAIGDNIQSSIMVSVLLKEMGARYILAKAQSELHGKVLYKLGVDKVVYPERDMGVKSAHSLISSNFIDLIELSSDYSIMEIAPPQSWYGKSIKELAVRTRYGINIVALRNRDNIIVSPTADNIISQGDIITVVGSNDDLKRLRKSK